MSAALGALDRVILSGLGVDLILGVIVLEFFVLTFRKGAPKGGKAVLDRLLALGPGALILLALRAALHGDGAAAVAAFLAASFPVHLADLSRRRL
jgi:hypothetical protein